MTETTAKPADVAEVTTAVPSTRPATTVKKPSYEDLVKQVAQLKTEAGQTFEFIQEKDAEIARVTNEGCRLARAMLDMKNQRKGELKKAADDARENERKATGEKLKVAREMFKAFSDKIGKHLE